MPSSHPSTLKEPSAIRYFKKMLIRFGLAKKVKHRDGAIFFRFLWKRIAVLMLAMAFAGYGILVAGAYFFIKYERDFSDIRYFDLFFPHRWDDYRVARGDYYIDQALEVLNDPGDRSGNPFLLLRTGVGLSPENHEGRLRLAEFYAQMGRSSTAIRVLEARLEENRDNREYLQRYLLMLFNNIRDDRVIEVGEELLAEGGDGTSDRDNMLATAVATAHYYRGNYDEAEVYIERYGLIHQKDGFLLQARIDWSRGSEDLAISRLEDAIDGGTSDHDVYLLLLDFLLEAGREDRAARVALLRYVDDPLSHEPLIGLIHVNHQTGRTESLQDDIDSYFHQFGRSEEAMELLAVIAGSWGDASLAERIYRHCQERGMSTEAAAYHWVETHVVAGNHRRALEVAENWDEVPAEWERGHYLPLQAQLAAAHYGAGNRGEGEILISELFGQGFLRPDHYARLAERLVDMGEAGQARRILAHVRNNYPHYQTALSRLIELDIATRHRADLLSNVREYLGMRQPSVALLEKAYAFIGSDLFLYRPEREEVLESLEGVLQS